MNSRAVPTLCAWKLHAGNLSPCEPEDPNACRFDIRYYAHAVGWATEVTVDNHFLAKQIQRAMMNHYLSGREAAMADLRQLIGANAR